MLLQLIIDVRLWKPNDWIRYCAPPFTAHIQVSHSMTQNMNQLKCIAEILTGLSTIRAYGEQVLESLP